ncbi:HlyD family efflux transporter periplasmic adaptor subunit [Segetibacter sp. 3557_3]|uniref:HlyD family secretion protein n=1 Tax=Segetibacter sp. 3557_3 TaxID=2547429 RepID=UPI0010584839|nr:HlyD family efflux transporter periplasmic adaptor subunit [Segetibacter sp. 3557_3]TDH28687.1 HlyD family efflux transporter periplasmic adaptor subunit [Segetibacter sp. 3557_3]
MKTVPIITLILISFIHCRQKENVFDAAGSFEAVETIVSAEASGTIKTFDVEEGQLLSAGVVVGYIDSLQLYLKKQQLRAQARAVLSRKPDIAAQTASLQEQLRHAEREQLRLENLVKADAATPKQLDEANAQIAIIKKQIAAQHSSLVISTGSLKEEATPIQVQVQQIDDQLARCRIVNPIQGTVLTKYAESNEVTAVGKPLYKIADVGSITLRAYITGDQISGVKTGQQVKVLVDDVKGTYKEYPGTISWISNKAEFTPKTIQTKDERANLVYAIKIRVKNDGYLKIGMYGEVMF